MANPGDMYNDYQAKKKHKAIKLVPPSKGHAPKGAHGRAAVHALGRTKTTGNFARIEKASGKGAAIAAYQNALHAHKGKKKHKKKGGLRPASAVVKSEQNASHQFYKKHKGKKKKAVPFISKASPSDIKKYPTPQKLGWGNGQGPLQKGTLNMKPGLGKSFFKKRKKKNDNDADDKKKGMKCKKHKKMRCKICM